MLACDTWSIEKIAVICLSLQIGLRFVERCLTNLIPSQKNLRNLRNLRMTFFTP